MDVGGLDVGLTEAAVWVLPLGAAGGWLEDLEFGKRKVPLLAFWLRLESVRRASCLMRGLLDVREEVGEDEDEEQEDEEVEEACASFSRSCCTSKDSWSTGCSMEEGMGWVKAWRQHTKSQPSKLLTPLKQHFSKAKQLETL